MTLCLGGKFNAMDHLRIHLIERSLESSAILAPFEPINIESCNAVPFRQELLQGHSVEGKSLQPD